VSGQSNGTLQIYTLGRFRVYYGQRDLTEEYSRSKKPWFLFKFLLTNNGEVFPSDYIMATLWPEEESQNPTHSLRNLVYRLRNLLEEEQGNGQYIVNQQGHYSFGREGEYWLDVEEMERAAKEAFLLEDENPKKIELLQRACELYEGEYLPTLAYESWTFNQRNYFQRLHLKTVRELNRLLKENGQFEEIIQHCEKIIDLEPFEECLHRDYIEALIENGQQWFWQDFFAESGIVKIHRHPEVYFLVPGAVGPRRKTLTFLLFGHCLLKSKALSLKTQNMRVVN